MIENDFVKVFDLNKNILCQFIESMTNIEINNRIKNYWTIYEHIEQWIPGVSPNGRLCRLRQRGHRKNRYNSCGMFRARAAEVFRGAKERSQGHVRGNRHTIYQTVVRYRQ